MATEQAGVDARARLAYWIALGVFVLLAAGTVVMASLAPMRADDPPVSRVQSIETSIGPDGNTSRVERIQTTTGEGGGSVLGWKVGRGGEFALQLVGGLLIAYLVSGLVHRVICGHYALKLLGVEIAEQATPIAKAADAASVTVDERRVLAEDTMAEQASLGEDVRPSSEPVDDDIPGEIGTSDIVFGLSDLSTSLSTVLRSLLTPPPRVPIHGAEDMSRVLNNRGVLPAPLATAVERVIRQCRTADARRSRARLDDSAMTYGPPLLADLRALRRTAARAFEQHVLSQVEQVPRCTVNRGTVIQGNQVDALAERNGSEIVVEVRSRVGPGATDAIEDTYQWLRDVPPDLPVLLIIPTEPTTSACWQEIRSRHGLTVLPWDEQHHRLADTLLSMLTSGNVPTPRKPATTTAAP